MEQYLQHLKAIVQRGDTSGDRTGTGTRRLQGLQMRFDLQEGFPMVTSKKVSFGFIKKELQWLLSGNTSNNVLRDDLNCSIWNEWADGQGRLGPIYGAMWRRYPANKIKIVKVATDMRIGEYLDEKTVDLMLRGIRSEVANTDAFRAWRRVLTVVAARGKMGEGFSEVPEQLRRASIDSAWLDFETFARDFGSLPGNEMVHENEWVVHTTNNGRGYFARDTVQFVETYKQSYITIAAVQTIQLHEGAEDFSQVYTPQFYIDQLAVAIDQIKNNPNSRRIIVDAWEPSLLPDEPRLKPAEQPAEGLMALAPCHCMFQFFVVPQGKGKKSRLTMHLYQRSADWCLGIPYNIASYALLTHLVARECDLDVGEFVLTAGDCHVYANHLEAARNQIRRKTHPLPSLFLDESIKKVSDFTHDKAGLYNYTHGPEIKYDVAV